MFIKDGKSLFSNNVLILAIVVLIVLLLLSYNKCMVPETFIGNSTNNAINNRIAVMGNNISDNTITGNVNKYPAPINVRINIVGGSVTVNFSVDIMNNKILPKNFLIVLVQYDNTMTTTGNNKFYLSNEYEINSAVSSSNKSSNNVCILVNGLPTCQYLFDNLDIIDNNNNPYYYKIGISAIYNDGNSDFATPSNINSINKVFTLNESMDYQNTLYDEFMEYKKQKQMTEPDVAIKNSNILSSADGQYELIKSQLGGYPDNLILNDKSNTQNSLADLIDKSMSQGKINVNISAISK